MSTSLKKLHVTLEGSMPQDTKFIRKEAIVDLDLHKALIGRPILNSGSTKHYKYTPTCGAMAPRVNKISDSE